MALTRWGFIYTAAGSDPTRDVTIVDTGACVTVLIGVERPEQGVDAALSLVREHQVQLIELCGGFGPVWAGRIVEAIDATVPVGVVAYGPESVDGVHAIFS